MTDRIRVAIVEDDSFQRALAVQVHGAAPDIMVVGAYETGRAAIEELSGQRTDVVVVDLGLPDLPGAEVARRLGQLQQPPEIVVLTAHGERAMALEALKASGTLSRNTADILDRTLAG